MAKNITLLGANYPDVPAVVLPQTGGGTATFMETSDADAAAADMLDGKTAYVNGSLITGSIPSKAATTYNTKASNQTIAAGQYLAGKQTIRAVTTENIDAENIKYNVTVKVGDSKSAGRIKNVTGTFTESSTVSSGQTAAAAGQILAGYSAWVDGAEIQGTFDMWALTVAELKALP